MCKCLSGALHGLMPPVRLLLHVHTRAYVCSGRNRAEEAAMAAISSSLLDVPITGAQGIVFNVLGGRDMTLQVSSVARLTRVLARHWCAINKRVEQPCQSSITARGARAMQSEAQRLW